MREGEREGGRVGERGKGRGRGGGAASSRRVHAASSTGGVESRLWIAVQFMQRLFPQALNLCRVQVLPRRGNGNWRGIAEGIKS